MMLSKPPTGVSSGVTLTFSSPHVTLASATSVAVGQRVSGAGIPHFVHEATAAAGATEVELDVATNVEKGQFITGAGVAAGCQVASVSASGRRRLTSGSAVTITLTAPTTAVLGKFSTTGTAAAGVTTVTLASIDKVATGQLISGAGVPAATTVSAISGSTITMSAATTAAIADEPLSFNVLRHTTSGTTANAGVTSLTLLSGTGVAVGQSVSGEGVPYGTVVSDVSSSPTIVISKATTSSITSAILEFTPTGTLTFIGTRVVEVAGSVVTLSDATTAALSSTTLTFHATSGRLTFSGSAITLSTATTASISSGTITFRATDGILTFSIGDLATRCADVPNANVVACSDGVATSVTSCNAGYYKAGTYSAGSTSNSCVQCTTVPNALTVTCASAAATQVVTCAENYKSSATYNAGTATSDSCSGVENRWPPDLTMLADDALTFRSVCVRACARGVLSRLLSNPAFPQVAHPHHSLCTTHHAPRTTHHSPLTAHRSLLTTHHTPRPTHPAPHPHAPSYHEKGMPLGFDPTRSAYWQDPCALFETLFVSNTTVIKSATIQFVNDFTNGDYIYFKSKVDSATGMVVTGEYEPSEGRLLLTNKASSNTYQVLPRAALHYTYYCTPLHCTLDCTTLHCTVLHPAEVSG